MTQGFQSLPLRREKTLDIVKFRGSIVNMKVICKGNVIVGATAKSLEKGRIFCSHFWDRYSRIDKDTRNEYEKMLECLVKLKHITQEEMDAEIAYLNRYAQLAQIKSLKKDIQQAFYNPEFIKYIEKMKGKIPEYLTSHNNIDKQFALALIKLKEVVDAPDSEES